MAVCVRRASGSAIFVVDLSNKSFADNSVAVSTNHYHFSCHVNSVGLLELLNQLEFIQAQQFYNLMLVTFSFVFFSGNLLFYSLLYLPDKFLFYKFEFNLIIFI